MNKILVIDDERSMLAALRLVLEREGFDVVTAESGEAALERLRAESFAVIVSDYNMPRLNGAQVLEQAQQLAPDTVRIMLTGRADFDTAMDSINRGAVFRFLAKPWHETDLCQAVRAAAERHELGAENRRLAALTAHQNEELRALNQTLEDRVTERTGEVRRLNDELKRSFLASIRMLSELAEMQGALVGRHAKRVTGLVKAMAELIGMRGDELYRLEIAALIHDIGKIGMPPPLLRKLPERMTPAEHELYLAHAVKGEIIARMVPNLDEAPQLIRNHHERFNGSGYPDRLRGAAIPFGARLIAVADGYDWHLYNRLQLGVSTPEKALAFVRTRATTWYDPELVNVLAACVAQPAAAVHEYEVVEVRRQDLREGMVPARDVQVGGQVVLARNTPIRRGDLTRLHTLVEDNPFEGELYIYHRKPAGR